LKEVRVGVISDTHGLLRPEALEVLRGSELLLHAGDVGDASILESLEAIAPVVAVRGNTDHGALGGRLPDSQVVEIGDVSLYLLHDIGALDLNPEAAGLSAVVFGHSHLPEIREEHGVLFFNPGSAGPRRFDYPVSVGFLHVQGGKIRAEVMDLPC
jgi:putative phosphoesterase